MMLFEFSAGLFAWISIGTGIAGFVFVALATFSDGGWWRVLYAFIASFVGKAVSATFTAFQRMLQVDQDVVDQMISAGSTEEQAEGDLLIMRRAVRRPK